MGLRLGAAGLLGFFLGCVMGLYRDRWPDRIPAENLLPAVLGAHLLAGTGAAADFCSDPGVVPGGLSSPIGVLDADVTIWQRLYHLALPAITLSLMSFSNNRPAHPAEADGRAEQ